jgi:hypothetical protein
MWEGDGETIFDAIFEFPDAVELTGVVQAKDGSGTVGTVADEIDVIRWVGL